MSACQADLGDLGVCLVADGLRADISGVGVGAGSVGGFQRGLGVVPGGVHCRGGGLLGLDGPGGLGEGHAGFGLGLAAGSVGGGQGGGDPARVGGRQLGGGGTGQVSGLGEQLLQAGQRASSRGAGCCPAAAGARRFSLCHLREHAGLQNRRGAPRPVAAGSSAPHPGCLQWRAPSGAGAAAAGGAGSGIWSGIWLVMTGAFLFLFRREEKE